MDEHRVVETNIEPGNAPLAARDAVRQILATNNTLPCPPLGRKGPQYTPHQRACLLRPGFPSRVGHTYATLEVRTRTVARLRGVIYSGRAQYCGGRHPGAARSSAQVMTVESSSQLFVVKRRVRERSCTLTKHLVKHCFRARAESPIASGSAAHVHSSQTDGESALLSPT